MARFFAVFFGGMQRAATGRRQNLWQLLGLAILCLGGTSACRSADQSPQVAQEPIVRLSTSLGDIRIQLHPGAAPKTVAHFLQHVDSGFYSGLTFHRVIPDFMIQGGGHLENGDLKPPLGQVVNESANGVSNLRGRVAMARSHDPDSASSQFYINQIDNTFLDAKPGQPGYTVFGTVIEGMAVVDAIAVVPRGQQGVDQPNQAIVIRQATRDGEAPVMALTSQSASSSAP